MYYTYVHMITKILWHRVIALSLNIVPCIVLILVKIVRELGYQRTHTEYCPEHCTDIGENCPRVGISKDSP